ncbi:Invasion protein IalB, involved in pathogenesis [Meinhardsimonia xiamenensis]|jgi:invasion protein IalB|uniref:Invasion protein IalB, involved in pathogenesis n=1 Tax=Meinhardsimonia xiamenensis TaxID=990712 RepID=A0A1G9GD24_9RHOB|nr:invasion associated locus B family protein [Meinhardsimonia xiamenensis]PRX31971.1 invasion protein IalB [Meinhardsimonia xiamenensis]SDK98183.1 Invasion protein IalB, involved in pathogenesis [Meinhardsimonia xiamenensis]
MILSSRLPWLATALALALALPTAAQESGADAASDTASTGESGSPADPLALNLGEDPATAAGTIYVAETHGDWEIRCVRTRSGAETPDDPCQLYQLLRDDAGNSVAEINLFPLPQPQGPAVAGATVVTPLETLLTQQLSLSVDGGTPRRYPFSWCSRIGCIARIGFTEAEIDQFRKGASATVSIFAVAAPGRPVELKMSLKGFTAGYKALQDRLAAQAAAGAAATEGGN